MYNLKITYIIGKTINIVGYILTYTPDIVQVLYQDVLNIQLMFY